jgi:pyruvate, water dikinase
MLIELENATDPGMFGGKASGLALARSLGLAVPPTTVLAPPALAEGGQLRDQWLRTATEEVVRWANSVGAVHLAVRSSAVVEDQAQHSYAGIFRSAFAPVDAPQIQAAITEVLDSASSAQRFAYEEAAGIPQGRPDMALVIQATVFPVRSGIMFSWGYAPVPQTRIQASWGLAVNLVQGITVGDSYQRRPPADPAVYAGDKPLAIYPLDPLGYASPGDFSAVDFASDGRESVASKVVFVDEESGLAYVRVPHDLAVSACLDSVLTAELERIASTPIPGYGIGMDVEWVEDVHGRVWVVQLRPATAFPPGETQDDSRGTTDQDALEAMVLIGEPGSPGTCRGAISDPMSILEHADGSDRVLVCGAARPELMPSVVRATGIVSSDGGILCHVAIVARELAKPCVIGIQHAERTLRENQVVAVDGTLGKVYLETGHLQEKKLTTASGPTIEFALHVDDIDIQLARDSLHIILVVQPDVERQLQDWSITEKLFSRFPSLLLLLPLERWRAEWETSYQVRQWTTLGFSGRLQIGAWQAVFHPNGGAPDLTAVLQSLGLERLGLPGDTRLLDKRLTARRACDDSCTLRGCLACIGSRRLISRPVS